ncbi:hypothetical protein [Rivularia sp. UHCC 0363]|uniref:hypothetical protein n=1 Tax=Rivularia sp. UHCC 0363 TaxID=3110244 RepID=UPI002B20BF9E|nr:hypothetical protein [Rivularia sp. UHCC 0363]MEA5596198.1 hypothetical protein [Rivularia sp. UHCC 0363]
MNLFNNILKQLTATVLSSLIAIALWLAVVPQAQAAITSTPALSTNDSKRIQAIAACLPAKLTIQNQDAGNRIANALSEMKNDQLERIFDVTDTPQLSDSEIAFKTCLQQKGFTPQAELQNRSFY